MLKNLLFTYLRIAFYDPALFFFVITPVSYLAILALSWLAERFSPGPLGILFLALALPFALSFIVSVELGRVILAEYTLDRPSKNDWMRRWLRRMLDRLEAERSV